MNDRPGIVLADDHHLVRQGLRLLLERADLSVVGEASDGIEAIEVTARLSPEVLVLDMMLPGLGGLDVILQIRKRAPGTRIVVLSMHSAEAFVFQAMRNGAFAYVLKSANGADLIQAIQHVLAGKHYLSPPLTSESLEAHAGRLESAGADRYRALTPREREVLHLTAEGLSNPAIGRRLSISARTAETHRAHVMKKLGLKSKTELITYALRRGLLPGAAILADNASPGEAPGEC